MGHGPERRRTEGREAERGSYSIGLHDAVARHLGRERIPTEGAAHRARGRLEGTGEGGIGGDAARRDLAEECVDTLCLR